MKPKERLSIWIDSLSDNECRQALLILAKDMLYGEVVHIADGNVLYWDSTGEPIIDNGNPTHLEDD